MSKQQIEFTIDETGSVSIKPLNFKDGKCQIATEGYEKILGLVSSRKITGPDCSSSKVRIKT